jgi:hypothetical protein
MLLIGTITSHVFDDAVYLQHNLWYYDLNVNPAYYWLQGTYYACISAAAYAPAVLLQSVGLHNVLVDQFFIKLPLIAAAVTGGPIVYQIVRSLGASESLAKLSSLVWISNPIVFFSAAIHGTGIVIAIVFLLGGFLALLKSRWDISAVLFGVSISTYLFPLFAIPVILRYIWEKAGKNQAGSFFVWLTGVIALGELPAVFASLAAGESFSQGLVISPGNLGTGSAAYPPSYSIYDVFNLLRDSSIFTQDQYTIIFVATLSIASLLIAIIPQRSFFTRRNLLTYFTFLTLGFVILNPGSTPQFLLAVVPFVIIEAVVWRERVILSLLGVAIVLDIVTLITWGPQDLLGFLSNTDPSLLQYSQTFPSNFNNALGMLYGVSLICIASYWLLKRALPSRVSNTADSSESIRTFQGVASSRVTTNFAVMIIVTFLALLVVAPVVGHPPNTMRLLDYLNTWQINGDSTQLNQTTGNVTTFYPLPGLIALLAPFAKEMVNASLNTTVLPSSVVSWFALNATFPFNRTVVLAESVLLPATYSNVTVEILTYGTGASSLVLTLCKGDTLASCQQVASIPGQVAQSTPAPGNAYLLRFNISGLLYSGGYYIELTGTSAATYDVGGSTFPPASAGVNPLSINGVIQPNSTLAIIVQGQESLRFDFNGHQLGSPNREGHVAIPEVYLTRHNELVENGTRFVPSSTPTLTIILAYSSYSGAWSSYPANLVIGVTGFAAIAVLWFSVNRIIWPGAKSNWRKRE